MELTSSPSQQEVTSGVRWGRHIVTVAALQQQVPIKSSPCAMVALPTSFPALSPGWTDQPGECGHGQPHENEVQPLWPWL